VLVLALVHAAAGCARGILGGVRMSMGARY
jgi:hypothetical protein